VENFQLRRLESTVSVITPHSNFSAHASTHTHTHTHTHTRFLSLSLSLQASKGKNSQSFSSFSLYFLLSLVVLFLHSPFIFLTSILSPFLYRLLFTFLTSCLISSHHILLIILFISLPSVNTASLPILHSSSFIIVVLLDGMPTTDVTRSEALVFNLGYAKTSYINRQSNDTQEPLET
jgi:hypothetical protein